MKPKLKASALAVLQSHLDAGASVRSTASAAGIAHTSLARWMRGDVPAAIGELEALLAVCGYEVLIVKPMVGGKLKG